jgi:hypothetical protein
MERMEREREQEAASRQKRPYTKPLLKKVHLRPEEAVLGACKVAGGGGPVGGTCGLTCSTAGS